MDVKYTTDDPIQTKPVSIPYTTNMVDTNITLDENSQYFSTPRKYNHSETASRAQVMLGFDTLQCQHNNTSQITLQELSPYGK